MKCQARVLIQKPEIHLSDGSQVFLCRPCGRAALDEKICVACAGLWGEPVHGFFNSTPPPTAHVYESDWFKERISTGASATAEQLALLQGPPPKPRLLFVRVKPQEAKTSKVSTVNMPAKKARAQPPPPPSSPTHGSLPAVDVAVPVLLPKKKRKAVAAPKTTPSRRRSPTARIADRADAPAVAIGDDFHRTQQKTEVLRSLLHVFEPAVFEEDGEPLEVDEYEYVKLVVDNNGIYTPQPVIGPGSAISSVDTLKFTYTTEKGICAL